MKLRRKRHLIFLKDTFILACTAFGGPQMHLMMMLDRLVEKRRYLTEAELMELQALTQLIPGPSSTQSIVALGYKIGGVKLALATLMIWSLPAMLLMTAAGIGLEAIRKTNPSLSFTRFVAPMAVAFLLLGGFKIAFRVIHNRQGWGIMVMAAVIAFFFPSPFMTPALIIIGAIISSMNFKKFPRMEKIPLNVDWRSLVVWALIFVITGVVGLATKSLPVRLFENFYRNGSLVFGGGQVLVSMLYAEFVQFKHYLSPKEFLAGLALTQIVPGPVFSIATFVGSLSMQRFGVWGQILGGFIATAGIFLPGTLLIFFVYGIWGTLKKYRAVRASLEGIHAAGSGLTVAAGVTLFVPFITNWEALFTIILTLLLSTKTTVPPYVLILFGFLAGLV